MKFYVDKLPESCRYCDLCKKEERGDKRFCAIDDIDVTRYYEQSYYYESNYIPDSCKLRGFPKGKKFAENQPATVYAYTLGWNECLIAILEGE